MRVRSNAPSLGSAISVARNASAHEPRLRVSGTKQEMADLMSDRTPEHGAERESRRMSDELRDSGVGTPAMAMPSAAGTEIVM